MNRFYQHITILLLGVATLPGCQKFLEQEPARQSTIQTADQLDALLNNPTGYPTYLFRETNLTAAYSTDDTQISQELYSNNTGSFTPDNMQYYTFAIDGISDLAADALWNGEFAKIFQANLILSQVEDVTGTDVQKAQIKADAHFIRAYSYWVLANYYCLPYSAETASEPGLPLKKTVSYTESLQRASLKETYDFIMADIEAAQQVPQDDVNTELPWRISKKAIAAFLSRYYLFLGDYDQCIQQANTAMGSSGAHLKDFHEIVAGNAVSYSNPSATLNYSEMHYYGTSQMLFWPEFFYTRFTYLSSQWMVPAPELINLYDQSNDLRYKWLMIEHGGRRMSVITPDTYRYNYFSDGRYYPSGPTMAEVVLNKAEALARMQDYTGAMQTVNLLRDKRMATADPLTASSAAEALTKVLEERRREMPFVMRWYDIRRFSVNEDASDDITVEHVFFKVEPGSVDVGTPTTYTLPVGSRRYAVPVNGVEMDASGGQIQQNTYE